MGPKHPYQRSCTDILCCILFCINVGVMIGFALYGYTNGDTTNVYRATDEMGNVCGGSNTVTKSYPYSYFYNPTTGNLDRRTCVKACPGLNGNSPSNIDCYSAGNNLGKCTYDVIVNSSGQFNTTPTTTDLIGYDTYSVIGRVCIPTATVFSNAFSSYTTTFNDKLRQAGIANFIEDVQNVNTKLYLELEMASPGFGAVGCIINPLYGLFEMLCWMFHMAIAHIDHPSASRCNSTIFIQWRCNQPTIVCRQLWHQHSQPTFILILQYIRMDLFGSILFCCADDCMLLWTYSPCCSFVWHCWGVHFFCLSGYACAYHYGCCCICSVGLLPLCYGHPHRHC